MKKLLVAIALLTVHAAVSAQAWPLLTGASAENPRLGGSDFGAGAAHQAMTVEEARIVDIQAATAVAPQMANHDARVLGGTVGTLAALAATRNVNSWATKAAVTAAFAAGGQALAGSHTSPTTARLLIVQTSAGQAFAVVQDDPNLAVGQSVWVIRGQGKTRVVARS